MAIGLVGCLALALGWRDRFAALALLILILGIVAFVDTAPLILPAANALVLGLLLGLHAATPTQPFGSWEARDRPDPAGDWRMPAWIGHLAWVLLALVYLVTDLERLADVAFQAGAIDVGAMAWVGLGFDGAFAIAVVRRGLRPSAWIAMSIWKLAWLFAFGPSGSASSLVLLHLLAFDPAWIPGRTRFRSAQPARLFYDGDCGLCHRSIRIILAEEKMAPDALRLRFAPIGGEAFASMVGALPKAERHDLPDSIVLEIEPGQILTRSAAAMEIALRLGGLWRAIAAVASLGGLVPNRALDVAYDFVARIRKRLFARPKDSCPILPTDLRSRFEI